MDVRNGIKFKEFHQKTMLVIKKKNYIKMNEDKIENIRRSQTYNIKLCLLY